MRSIAARRFRLIGRRALGRLTTLVEFDALTVGVSWPINQLIFLPVLGGPNSARGQWMVMAHVHGCARFKIGAQILCHRRQRASNFLMSGVSYASVVCPRGNCQIIQRTRLAKAGFRVGRLVCPVVARHRGACSNRGRSRAVTRLGFTPVKTAIPTHFSGRKGIGRANFGRQDKRSASSVLSIVGIVLFFCMALASRSHIRRNLPKHI